MDSYRINSEFKVILKNDKEVLKKLDNISIKLNEVRKLIIEINKLGLSLEMEKLFKI